MKEKEIKKLIKEGESGKLEFKESLKLKNEICETVSALSNTSGGMIFVGISDSGEIKGIDIGKKTIEGLANYIKQNTDNQIYPKIIVENIGKTNIIVIEVNETYEKPVFFRGKSYKRIGKSNHKLSASEIRELAKKSGKKSYWDEQICEESSYEELDNKKVEWYLKQREKHRNISRKIKIPLNRFLENIKVVKNGKLTNGGVVFFGKNPLKFIPHAQLRLVRIKGNKLEGIILDRLDCDGTLWEMAEQAEKFLKENIRFMGFRTAKRFQREDKFDIPIKAMGELIINALIHRDYETTADVRVFIFDDRIEVINPGSFPEGVTPKNPMHKPVNMFLSQYMYDIGLIEKYGSGIANVRSLLKENGNKEPEYVLHKIETKVVVYSQAGGETTQKTREKTRGKTREKIIQLMKENRGITIIELSDKIGISEKGVEWQIDKLKKEGVIQRIGGRKGGYWKVVEKGEAKKEGKKING